MEWQVGDVAICVTPGSKIKDREVVIMSPPYPVQGRYDLVHEIDPGIPPGGFYVCWGAEARHLKPLPDPRLPGTWDECVFKPASLALRL